MAMLTMPWTAVPRYLDCGPAVSKLTSIIEGRDSRCEGRAVIDDVPWHGRLFWHLCFVDDEANYERQPDDQWGKDLSRVPREADTTECQANHGERCASDHDSIATEPAVS